MHNTNHNKLVAILLIFTTPIHAYEFSFFNKTSTPIAIAIQFSNSEQEPLYKLYVKPDSMNSFVPGNIDIPDIKWSFCLGKVYYAKNPTMQERAHHFAKTIWKKVSITWTDKLLQTTKKPKKSRSQKKQKATKDQGSLILTQKPIAPDNKSLCKDRHFEITEDKHGTIIIMGSTAE